MSNKSLRIGFVSESKLLARPAAISPLSLTMAAETALNLRPSNGQALEIAFTSEVIPRSQLFGDGVLPLPDERASSIRFEAGSPDQIAIEWLQFNAYFEQSGSSGGTVIAGTVEW